MILWGTAKLFSIATIPFHSPISSAWRFQLGFSYSKSSSVLVIFCVCVCLCVCMCILNNSHSKEYEAVSRCISLWFSFPFPWWLIMLNILSWAYLICISSLEKRLFKSFDYLWIVGFFCCCWVFRVLDIFCIWLANIFFPVLWVVFFTILIVSSDAQPFSLLMNSNSSIFSAIACALVS